MKPHLTLAFLLALPFLAPAANPATQPSADGMLATFRDLKPPVLDAARYTDPEYAKDYAAQREAVQAQREALAWDFYQRFPDHPKAGSLLTERWMSMTRKHADQVLAEAQQVLDRQPPVPARADALFARAAVTFMGPKSDPAKAKPLIEDFLAAHPKDPRAPMLLQAMAERATEPAEKATLNARLARDYPDSGVARMDAGAQRLRDAVGKPFDLSFTDVITGKPVSVQKDLKGKLVVIDFWATWCGPCVAEMPKLKDLYARYHDQGLEIIGVSLDRPESEGGLDDLKAFVKKNDIPWPQYYQGDAWEGEFSSKWGIRSIPTVFLVGPDGTLLTPNARGQLEHLIPQHLKARGTAAAAP